MTKPPTDTMKKLAEVSRFEVIDWTSDGSGRAYTKHKSIQVEYELQDNNKTLKIFLSD